MLSFSINNNKSSFEEAQNGFSSNGRLNERSNINCLENVNQNKKSSRNIFDQEFYCCCGKKKQPTTDYEQLTEMEEEKKMQENINGKFIVISSLKIALIIVLIVIYNQFIIYQVDKVRFVFSYIK